MLPVAPEGIGTLQRIELWGATTELVTRVGTSYGAHHHRPLAYVRVCTSASEGFGEIAALEDPAGVDPTLAVVLRALEERWIPTIIGASEARSGRSPESSVIPMLGGATAIDRVAAAALEMAVLDAELRLEATNLAAWLGVEANDVPFGAVIGIPSDRSIDQVVEDAISMTERGATRLRVKVAPSFASEPLRQLRAALGGIALHADANGSFSARIDGPGGIAELQSLDPIGLVCLEEPIAGRDLAEAAVVADAIATPICLDESISTRRAARDAVRYGACTMVCLKPGRVGGLRAALGILDDSAASGVPVFIGGLFESGLGRAVLGALAAHEAASLVSDVGAPSTYLVEDPCGLEGPVGTQQPIYQGPGVGPWPRATMRSLLASWAIA